MFSIGTKSLLMQKILAFFLICNLVNIRHHYFVRAEPIIKGESPPSSDPRQAQQQRSRRSLKSSCSKKDEEKFYYKTKTELHLGGGNPSCSNSDLKKISDVLSSEYSKIVSIDPRLRLVYEVSTDICDKYPSNQQQNRRLDLDEVDEEDAGVSNNHVDDNDDDQRRLGFTWKILNDFDKGKRYQFDWNGIGDCRWCTQVNSPSDTRTRNLRGEMLNDTSMLHDNDEEQVQFESSGNLYEGWSPLSSLSLEEENTVHNQTSPSSSSDERRLQTTPEVVSLGLYNTRTNQRVRSIEMFDVLDLRVLGQYLSIRAETSGIVGSLAFGLDDLYMYKMENYEPFFIAGDMYYYGMGLIGDFPEIRQLGTHTVTARPYSHIGGSGQLGTEFSTTFLVIDSSRYNQEPDTDSKLVDVLEEDISFHLSLAVNKKFFLKKGHCLKGRVVYVRVDITGVRTSKYKC